MNKNSLFTRFAKWASHATGRPLAFIIAAAVIVIWAVTGPLFDFDNTWQLVINTGTTIVTFLMVFLIQNSQNRDGAAIQAKLDELIRASAAQNRFIGVEQLTEEQLTALRQEDCGRAAKLGEALEAADRAEDHAQDKADAAAKAA